MLPNVLNCLRPRSWHLWQLKMYKPGTKSSKPKLFFMLFLWDPCVFSNSSSKWQSLINIQNSSSGSIISTGFHVSLFSRNLDYAILIILQCNLCERGRGYGCCDQLTSLTFWLAAWPPVELIMLWTPDPRVLFLCQFILHAFKVLPSLWTTHVSSAELWSRQLQQPLPQLNQYASSRTKSTTP